MKILATLYTTAVACAILIPGCAAPTRTGPITYHTFSLPDETASDNLWNTSKDVLREHMFTISHTDRRAGIITTAPETSGQLFEFWRNDVATATDLWDSTMRTVRRKVEISIGKDPESQTTRLTVTVTRERFTTPERQVNNSIAAFRLFGYELPQEQTGQRISPNDSYWMADGRDPALEQLLLQEILEKSQE